MDAPVGALNVFQLNARAEYQPVDQIMIGPEQPAWDIAAIMYFPTRRAFMEMLSDSEFQLASRHGKAAFANHSMLHLTGDPFTQ